MKYTSYISHTYMNIAIPVVISLSYKEKYFYKVHRRDSTVTAAENL